MMKIIESALIRAINKHPNIPVVIAYSGGVDSQVLLHALATLKHANKIPNSVTVCHVNHGLSDNANKWQYFAKQECEKRKLTFIACHVNVQKKAQQSLEAIAREARYQALHSVNREQSLIITGHHRDDQAETFLLALKRGAGLKGLSSMAAETTQDKDIIIRPLLDVSRNDIVHAAKEQQLNWVEDESNADLRFDRNFIRQTIMPLLNERWPSISQTISRSGSHCFEGQLLLNELAEQDLVNAWVDEQCLSISELKKLSIARFNNLIRYFLEKYNCVMPSTEQLTQVYKQLFANEDKNPAVKVADNYLRRFKGRLYLTEEFVDVSDWQAIVGPVAQQYQTSTEVIELPNNIGKLIFGINSPSNESSLNQRIAVPNKGQKVTVRFSHNNPVCLPDFRNHSRHLKKVLQELNIPPWQRKRTPFIYYDDVLVAVIGYFVCQKFVPEQSEPAIIVTWNN